MNNVLFTKVTFFRNVQGYKFVPKLTNEAKEEIVNKLSTALNKKMSLIHLANADKKVVEFLRTNELIMNNSNNVFTNKDNVCINLFLDEHLHIIASQDGFDEEVFSRAKSVVDLLSEKVSLSFNDEYGYLMSDVSRLGAGLMLECDICLDSISALNKIDQVKQNMKKLGYTLNATKHPSIFRLSTRCNLGFKEKEIFDEFVKIITKLDDLEIESAKVLDLNNHDELVDKARRSEAILNSAYILTYDELEQFLINLRVGNNLGVVKMEPSILIKLQSLIKNKNTTFMSESELKSLAETVKNMLKGE